MELDTITYLELEKYIDQPNVRIIDLRSRKAYRYSHIKGSENIPYFELEQGGTFFNKNDLILFYCDRGNSSLMASRNFNQSGYETKAVVGIFLNYEGKYIVS